MPFNNIMVAGAGAIGSVIAARLALADLQPTVLARGPTLEALQRDGLRLDDLSGAHHVRVTATDDASTSGIQDLIFLCAKAAALPALMAQLRPAIGPNTTLVPGVNGIPWWYFQREGGRFDNAGVASVDPDAVLLSMVPPQQIVGAVLYMTAEITAPGCVRSDNPYLMVLGETDHRLTPRVQEISELLAAAGIGARASARIRDDVWSKVIGNLTSNPLSVVTGATLDAIYGAPELRDIVTGVLREATLVAASYGARINADPDAIFARGASLGAFRTSMLQDHLQGRPLELAAIGDAVVELAGRYDIPMPTTQILLGLTRYCAAHALLQRTDLQV